MTSYPNNQDILRIIKETKDYIDSTELRLRIANRDLSILQNNLINNMSRKVTEMSEEIDYFLKTNESRKDKLLQEQQKMWDCLTGKSELVRKIDSKKGST
jgi:uncharacterized protein (DUF2344 family)